MTEAYKYSAEVDAICKSYRQREADAEWQASQNSMLDELTARYRVQQIMCLADSLRRAGTQDLSSLSILEVGCGSGNFLRSLFMMGADPGKLHGTDVRADALERARAAHPQFDLRVTDGTSLPYEDDNFDLVIQCMVFMNLGNADMAAELACEMVRCVRPGGYVWWCDLPRTLSEFGSHELDIDALFHGLRVTAERYGDMPRPSQCLCRRRWRISFGWLLDRLAHRRTHVGALVGPKPHACALKGHSTMTEAVSRGRHRS